MKSGTLSTMARRVESTCRRFQMLRPGMRLGVAVSGGADSIALLLLLRELAPAWGLQLAVLHVQHGLRPEAEAEAEFTRQLAARLQLDWRGFNLKPPAGGNLEQWARRERYACFRRYLDETAADAVATGHQRDDQAETVLLRLLRGAGPRGLAGIWPVVYRQPGKGNAAANGPTAPGAPAIIRPLLERSRRELREYLQSRGQAWMEDASNASPRFLRNRVRQELLPRLEREFNPGIVAALARLAEQMRAEELDWQTRVTPLAEELWRPAPAGGWQAETRRIAALPLAMRRRLVLAGLEAARGGRLPAAGDAVETVCRWAEAAATTNVPPRRRELARLRITVGRRWILLQTTEQARR